MSIYVRPYKKESESAIKLAEALDTVFAGVDVAIRRGNPNIKIINWGKGDALPEEMAKCTVLNKPDAICKAVNKISAFTALKEAGVRTPDWSTSRIKACEWIIGGHKVFCRTKVEGRDGDGLVVTEGFSFPPDAPLYTKHVPALAEYRVNTTVDKCIGVQKKVRTDGQAANGLVKTGGNGYGFHLLPDNDIPNGIRPIAKEAIKALGLDFGGVDIIVGEDGLPYVLEINTAPELTPAMVTAYARAFKGGTNG